MIDQLYYKPLLTFSNNQLSAYWRCRLKGHNSHVLVPICSSRWYNEVFKLQEEKQK